MIWSSSFVPRGTSFGASGIGSLGNGTRYSRRRRVADRRAWTAPSRCGTRHWCGLEPRLTAARLEAVGLLVPHARARYEAVAGRPGLALGLRRARGWRRPSRRARSTRRMRIDDAKLEEMLAAKLDEVRPRELERGLSLAGPQRDDVSVRIGTVDGGAAVWTPARTPHRAIREPRPWP